MMKDICEIHCPIQFQLEDYSRCYYLYLKFLLHRNPDQILHFEVNNKFLHCHLAFWRVKNILDTLIRFIPYRIRSPSVPSGILVVSGPVKTTSFPEHEEVYFEEPSVHLQTIINAKQRRRNLYIV